MGETFCKVIAIVLVFTALFLSCAGYEHEWLEWFLFVCAVLFLTVLPDKEEDDGKSNEGTH